jgi:hypothetical protein
MDAFICHASEDKDSLVRPLVGHLTKLGYQVWYDEFSLKLGDSLRRSIDKGLREARYGIVVLSPNFFAKNWTRYELDGLVARENDDGEKVILPVWHGVTRDQVASFSPTLADRVAVLSSRGLDIVSQKICEVLGPISTPRTSVLAVSIGADDKCPQCGQKGNAYGFEGADGDEFHWFECNHCGFFTEISGGGWV